MYYSIRPNYFAPILKYSDDASLKVHAIVYNRCNFNCHYCTMRQRDPSEFHSYTNDEFVMVASKLISMGRLFKFTGGEPTLNKHLRNHLAIVKDLGGKVLIDTNGSRPDVIEDLLKHKLVDLVSVSMKGLSPEVATNTSGCRNLQTCWDNVMRTIDLCEMYNQPIIVTYVFVDNDGFSDFEKFSELFKDRDNVILKFNNLMYQDNLSNGLHCVENDLFESSITRLLNTYPNLQGRVIAIPSEECVTDRSKILYF